MIDQELLDYMKEYKDLMEETLNRVDALENLVYKEILEPCQALNEEYEHNVRKNAFLEKHGEKLSAFNDKLKAIEGDDFDLASNTFEEYDKSDKSIAEDDYVAALIAKVQDQLLKISNAFGAPVEVETQPNGDIEVVADGEVVAVAQVIDSENEHEHTVNDPNTPTETVTEHNDHNETSAENANEIVEEEIEEEIDTPEEIEALQKELEEEMKKEGK